MSDESNALGEAIEGLYGTFDKYPLRPWTEPCMHCHTEEDEQAIRRRPLRELRPEDLLEFAADSLMTWGERPDFKHFLPRLFEILATVGFPDDYPDTETVIGGLERGEWRSWPADEQKAIDDFLRAFWRSHLTTLPAARETDTVISSIATAVDDMSPYLDCWIELADEVPAAVHFAEFLIDNVMHAALGKRLSNPWLSDRHEQEAQVRHWLIDHAREFAPRLEQAFLDASDEDVLAILEPAIDVARNTIPSGTDREP